MSPSPGKCRRRTCRRGRKGRTPVTILTTLINWSIGLEKRSNFIGNYAARRESPCPGNFPMKLDEFICTECGECCRHIENIPALKHIQKNGVCIYLDGNRCSIYPIRPFVCNRYTVYEQYRDEFSEEEFMYVVNYYCNFLKELRDEQTR